MKLRTGLFVGAVAFGVAFAVGATAQDLPQRKELKRVDLSGAQNMEVVSSVSTFNPGDVFPRHLHHGVEAGIATSRTPSRNWAVALEGSAPSGNGMAR